MMKKILHGFLLLGALLVAPRQSCLGLVVDSSAMPTLVYSGRNTTIYSSEITTVYDSKLGKDVVAHSLIYTDPEKTFKMLTSIDAVGGMYAPRNIMWEGIITPKKSFNDYERLPLGAIGNLPICGADLLGVHISAGITDWLKKNSRFVFEPRKLVVWQGVAIDPDFRYHTQGKCDAVVVENALLQSADITQTLTHPSQLLAEDQHGVRMPPSHDTLFSNAVSRASIPHNSETAKHKLFLVYEQDVYLLSDQVLRLFAKNNWYVVVLGDKSLMHVRVEGFLGRYGIDFLYINCLGKTQDRLRDMVVQVYTDKLQAAALSK